MKFPKLKITRDGSQFNRWAIDVARDFPEKVFGLPAQGRFVVVIEHPGKNALLEYPGRDKTYSARQAINALEKLYEMTGDPDKQWIERV